jgi:hypothetical protein
MAEILEKTRLKKQAQKRKTLTKIHYRENIIKELEKLKQLEEKPYSIEFSLEFSDEENFVSYLQYAAKRFADVGSRSGKVIRIVKSYLPSDHEKFLEELDVISTPRSFNFSPHLQISVSDQKGNSLFTLLSSDTKELPNATVLKKIPYEDRTTYFDITYNRMHEKDILKNFLKMFFRNQYALETLSLDSVGRKLGYEKFSPREDHLHHRIDVHGRWKEFRVRNKYLFFRLINQYDAMCFYPKLKQDIEFESRTWKNLTTRFVNEVDPGAASYSNSLSDIIKSKLELMKKFQLPVALYHSGSASPRIQGEIDAQSILESMKDLFHEFMFIGYAVKEQPLKRDEETYECVINAFNTGIHLLTWNEMKEGGVPTIMTNNDRSAYRPRVPLDDFPRSVSIGLGSAKCIVRDLGVLEYLKQNIPEYKNWEYPFFFTHCNIVEKIPETKKEIALACNSATTAQVLEKNYERMRELKSRRITVENVRRVFGSVNSQQFIDIYTMEEKDFIQKYSNLDFSIMVS